MASNSTKELNYYYILLNRCLNQIVCPHCNESVFPKNFDKHCLNHHNINGKNTCVWCQNVSWPSGEKYKHKIHLLTCFKNFIRHHVSPSNTDIATDIQLSQLLDITHSFLEKDFFGHRMSHPNPMFETLEEFLNTPLPEPNLPPLLITFADDNLNLAASCVLLYLSDTLDFFHVMIKLLAAENFNEVMRESRCSALPFSCWCDGGTYREAECRQHRHLIVVAPKNHFRENVWPQIKIPPNRRPRNFPCKRLKKIVSPLHLVNTIGYVSQRKSRCNFSFTKDKLTERNNHFYFYKTLPVSFKLHLVLLWDGGVTQLLYETKFQNISVSRLAQGILTHDGRRWTQKIKDFYGHEKGMIAHVTREYIPTNRITPHFLHLAEGKKLYFNMSPEHRNLEPSIWLQKQVEGGNCFYDAVEENEWIPRPKDQKILNFYKPAVDRIKELESNELKIKTLERKNKQLHIKVQKLTDQIIKYKDKEINKQKHEISRLNQEISRLNQEIERLKMYNEHNI